MNKLALVFLTLSVAFGVAAGHAVLQARAVVLPPPTQVELWLPQNHEIVDYDSFRPGASEIKITLDEFKKRFPMDGLLLVSDGPFVKRVDFLASPYGGTYYRASAKIEKPVSWSQEATTLDHLEIRGNAIFAYPGNGYIVPAVAWVILSVTLGMIAFGIWRRNTLRS